MSQTRDSLIQYYKDLLIIQYRDKPRAQETIRLFISALLAYDLFIAIRDGFDLDTAVGPQLDIVGKYVGVNRTITGTTFSRNYFGFEEYGATSPFDFFGYIGYSGHVPDVQMRNYKESTQSLYAMTDEEMRVMIKLAIVRNMSNGSVKDFDEILDTLFGADVLFTDRQNMTVVSYLVGETNARIFLMAKSSGLLPNPAGVGTVVNVVPDITAIFGFSRYGGTKSDYIVGYAEYPSLGEFDFDLNATIAPVSSFYGVCTDPSGNKWFSTRKPVPTTVGRIFVVYAGTDEYIDVGADDLNYRHICSDSAGNIFVAVYGGRIRRADAGTTTFVDITTSDANWEGIAVDPSGNIWATISGGGLYVSEDSGATFNPVSGPTDYRGLCSDDEGNIFVSLLYSLARIPAGTTTLEPITMPAGEYNGVTVKNGVLWVTEERSEGYIWKASVDDFVFSNIEQTYFFPRAMAGITVDNLGGVWATTGIYIAKAELVDEAVGCVAGYATIV